VYPERKRSNTCYSRGRALPERKRKATLVTQEEGLYPMIGREANAVIQE
jgi:hypothetical protein